MESIEHIGIAVENEAASVELFNKLLGKQPYKMEEVEKDGVKTIFYALGDTKIELLVPTRPDSPIQKFLDKKGPGIHHIAFGVNKINLQLENLEGLGFELIDKTARLGADNKSVAFLHPKSTAGVLVEICE
ncbi:MAG: hypothetical protein DDT42_02066 [candidate division WS2 bacterium]|uniref:VOC domain-containing protein n=1 Tax=Psychracetigena formicireducens TaxID=2986056 RepID=A0A9E2BNE7_PSYF1|nr:hypothetical protein [Candidatus Psychracetigena formicireducens]